MERVRVRKRLEKRKIWLDRQSIKEDVESFKKFFFYGEEQNFQDEKYEVTFATEDAKTCRLKSYLFFNKKTSKVAKKFFFITKQPREFDSVLSASLQTISLKKYYYLWRLQTCWLPRKQVWGSLLNIFHDYRHQNVATALVSRALISSFHACRSLHFPPFCLGLIKKGWSDSVPAASAGRGHK